MAHLEGFEPPTPSSEDWEYGVRRRSPLFLFGVTKPNSFRRDPASFRVVRRVLHPFCTQDSGNRLDDAVRDVPRWAL